MGDPAQSRGELEQEIRELRAQLAAAEERLRALREGDVDAPVIATPVGQRVSTLQDADQTYRTIVEQMQEGAVTLVEDGHVNYCNQRFAEMLKRPLEEIVGAHFCGHLVEPDRGRVQQLLRQAPAGAVRDELTLQAGDGTQIPVRVSLAPFVHNGLPAISMVVTDLTERNRFERLLASERLLAAVLEFVPEGITIADAPDVKIRMVSRYGEQLAGGPHAGLTAEAVVTQWKVYHQDGVTPMAYEDLPLVRAIQRGEIVTHAELVQVGADGRRLSLLCNAAPLRDETGTVVGAIVAWRDISQLKQAEAALRASEERMQQALRVSRSFTFDWEPATDRVQRSGSCETILKLTGDEAVNDTGQHFFQRVHPDDRARFAQTLRELTPAANAYSVEYCVVCGDGGVVVVEEIGRAVFDAAGNLERLVGVTTDITERKRAEKAMRASEQRFRQVVESLPQLVWTCRADGPCDYLGPQWVNYTGIPEAPQLGYGWLEQLHPDDRDRAVATWQATAARGDSFAIEFRLRRYDGVYRWFRTLAVPLRDDAGQIVKWFGSNTDIQDIKEAEAAVHASEDRLSFALETSHTGAWDLDLVDHTANRSLEHDRIFGYEQLLPQWTYEMFLEHVLPEDRAAVDAKFRTATVARGDWSFECRIRRVDGEVRWIWAAGGHRGDARGSASRMGGIVQDITDRKQAEAALRESRRAALNLMDDAVAARQQTEQTLAALRQSQADLDRAQAVGQIGSWRLDVRRNVLTWSDENHRIFGLPKGTPLTYETFLGAIHPDDRQYVDTQWQAALRGESYDIEHRLVVDGQVKWVREKAYLEFNDAGELLGGFGITEDITDRKRAEEEIRMLSKFPEQNPSPVLRVARSGIILYANAASEPLLTDWKARPGDSVPPDWLHRVTAVLDSGQVQETEIVCEGRVYSCDLAPIVERGYLNVYARDVTERRRAEKELRQAKEDWEDTFNTVPDLVAILDCQHRIVRANRAMAERLKLASGSGVGLPCYEIVHGTSPPPPLLPARADLPGRPGAFGRTSGAVFGRALPGHDLAPV